MRSLRSRPSARPHARPHARRLQAEHPKLTRPLKTFTPTQYSVADFYGNKEFFGASFSPDRQKILVGSNLSGIWNAYAVPVAGGDPEPLTTATTNSIFPVSYFPGDGRILYSSDEGGNELAHIYVRNVDGSVKDVTPGTKHVAQFAGWAGDDKSFYITTNERDPRYFDLYEIKTDGLARSSSTGTPRGTASVMCRATSATSRS